MDLSAIALQGLQQADLQLTKAATALTSFGANSPDGAGVDVVDLTAEIVALMSAKNEFAVNIQTLKTADAVQQSLIDVTA